MVASGVVAALVIGSVLAIGRSPEPSRPAATTANEQPSLEQTTSTLPQATPTREVRGWPTTTQNPAGTYSWDGRTCAGRWCSYGFMHNGYASGNVDIHIRVASETGSNEGQTAVTIAGHDALYRRIGARTGEEWIVGIEGMTLAILLQAEPDTSDAELAEAHAIIESMRTEPRDTPLGFRLVFTLVTDDWDSG